MRLSLSDVLSSPLQTLASLSFRGKLLVFACTVLGIELLFRRLAPRSGAYAAWQRFFEGLGTVWQAVILAIVYFFSVSFVAVGMRLLGKDLLDRALLPEPSFWRRHEPNPLGPRAAARHQF